MKNQKGFSLVELLVVVIIIAIIAAIAIPSLLSARRTANDASAIANLRQVHTGLIVYASSNNNQYPATFAAASGAGQPLDASWTGTPVKNTYTYTYTVSGTAGFCVTAKSAATSSGEYSYAVSHEGVIYRLAGTAVPTCDAATGAISTGSVVGS